MGGTGVEVRELHGSAACAEAAGVLARVWRTREPPLDAGALVALAHSGNYVVGAFEGERMVGAAAGFFGPPAARTLHSHITGVLPEAAGRGIGRAIKEHQGEWCRSRGVTTITWSFDPLIARNAHFNLERLRARVTEYAIDLYGPMADGLNAAGEPSDRLLVAWDLTATAPSVPADGEVLQVAVPPDIESLRRTDPPEATRWRLALRATLGGPLRDGWRIVGFRGGRYLLTKGDG